MMRNSAVFRSPRVSLQLVVGRDVPQFLDVKGATGTAGDKDGLCRLCRRPACRFYTAAPRSCWAVALQGGKPSTWFGSRRHPRELPSCEKIMSVVKFFPPGRLPPDKGNQGGVEEFHASPKNRPRFFLSLGVEIRAVTNFKILFTAKIDKGVIMQTFPKLIVLSTLMR